MSSRANHCVILKHSFTHLLPVSTWCLAFYPFVTHSMEMLQKWILQHLHFFRRIVSSKTTGHFSKNDGSLFENDRSFLHNRRVVFINTWGVWKSHRRKHKRIPRISFVKIPIFTRPHARTRTRTLTTGIFDFLLSQVSQNFHNILFFRILECGQDVF